MNAVWVSLAVLSISGAVFLIIEMYTPFDGILRISTAPLHAAAQYLRP